MDQAPAGQVCGPGAPVGTRVCFRREPLLSREPLLTQCAVSPGLASSEPSQQQDHGSLRADRWRYLCARARTDYLVSSTAQGGDCSSDGEMGRNYWREGGRVGGETDENQVGYVQY